MEQIVPEKERQEEQQYCCRIGRVFAETLALAVPLHAPSQRHILVVILALAVPLHAPSQKHVLVVTLALAVPLHASIKKQVLLVTIVPNRGDPGFHSIEATLAPIRGDPSL